jgi:glycosyltransferase involved in cell wall biosynthesis
MPQPTALYVAYRGFTLASSRRPLLAHLLAKGWRVVAALNPDEHTKHLTAMGVTVAPVPFKIGGFSPRDDVRTIRTLAQLYRQQRPAFVHHFNAKPIILGGAAAQLSPVSHRVNTITGLGTAFDLKDCRRIFAPVFRAILRGSHATIFQNPDDRAVFIKKGWVRPGCDHLIIGSGVDLDVFKPQSRPIEPPLTVFMASRLLWSKGVREFVEAARRVRQQRRGVIFQLAGEFIDGQADAVDRTWIQAQVEAGTLDFLGYVTNMPAQLAKVDLLVLPSAYREGVPRILQEAAAMGIPAVTTATPGCQSAVIDGQTGLLVPPHDAEALTQAIMHLIEDDTLRLEMGRRAHAHARTHFDIQTITRKTLDVYRNLGLAV